MKKLLLAGGAAALMTASTAYASIIDRPYFKVLGVVVVWGAEDYNENTGAAPVASDFVLLTNAGAIGEDLIADDGYTVVTGSLTPISDVGDNSTAGLAETNPVTNATSGGVLVGDNNGVLDAGDSLSAFGLDATNTDVGAGLVNTHTSSFFVASNAAFEIHAQSTVAATTGDFTTMSEADISYAMSATTTNGAETVAFGSRAAVPAGTFPAVANLGAMVAAPIPVFQGTEKTAVSAGSLAQQSVRFDNTYTLGGLSGYDLSMGVGTITADVTYTVYAP